MFFVECQRVKDGIKSFHGKASAVIDKKQVPYNLKQQMGRYC